jgi:hypothetical protein
MADVRRHKKGLIEENVLGLLRSYLVPLPILVCIAFVPLKACTAFERIAATPRHKQQYMSEIYCRVRIAVRARSTSPQLLK